MVTRRLYSSLLFYPFSACHSDSHFKHSALCSLVNCTLVTIRRCHRRRPIYRRPLWTRSSICTGRGRSAVATVAHKISDRGQTNEIAPAKGTTSRGQPERRPREGQKRTAMKPRRATLGLTNSPCLASSPALPRSRRAPGRRPPSVRGAGGHISRPVSLTCYNGIRLLPRPSLSPSLAPAHSNSGSALPLRQHAKPRRHSPFPSLLPNPNSLPRFLPILSRRAKQTWAFGVIPMLIVDAPAASRESREIKLLLQLV